MYLLICALIVFSMYPDLSIYNVCLTNSVNLFLIFFFFLHTHTRTLTFEHYLHQFSQSVLPSYPIQPFLQPSQSSVRQFLLFSQTLHRHIPLSSLLNHAHAFLFSFLILIQLHDVSQNLKLIWIPKIKAEMIILIIVFHVQLLHFHAQLTRMMLLLDVLIDFDLRWFSIPNLTLKITLRSLQSLFFFLLVVTLMLLQEHFFHLLRLSHVPPIHALTPCLLVLLQL
mmetsp:Transcript_50318/g.64486  ORF Transcript_50318/g.64486 Transcript_50318/m.64486 type:complete len:225 (+) Transcript_50318:524-1198(+)